MPILAFLLLSCEAEGSSSSSTPAGLGSFRPEHTSSSRSSPGEPRAGQGVTRSRSCHPLLLPQQEGPRPCPGTTQPRRTGGWVLDRAPTQGPGNDVQNDGGYEDFLFLFKKKKKPLNSAASRQHRGGCAAAAVRCVLKQSLNSRRPRRPRVRSPVWGSLLEGR